jgi:hypothetical protein
MDTPQTTIPTPARNAAFSPARLFLFGGIILVAIVSVMLAVLLPNSIDDRSQAASAAACAGKVVVAGSACNGGCNGNADCMEGMICHTPTGSTTKVCRNKDNPNSTTCTGTTSSPTPVACTQLCEKTVANSCPTGKTCVGPTTSYRTTATIATASQTVLTAAEIAQMPAGRNIIAFRETFDKAQTPAIGRMTYHVVARTAQTYYVNLYQITGVPPALDPQVLLKRQSLTVNASSRAVVNIDVPTCGRYQVDFELASGDPGSIPLTGDTGYFWGDNQLTFKCPGCCQ